jgi:hypothetical protein
MKQIEEMPEIPDVCPNQDHWLNMLIDGKCFTCGKVFALSMDENDGRRFHDMGDFDEDHDDERTADAVVGVGDAPANEN